SENSSSTRLSSFGRLKEEKLEPTSSSISPEFTRSFPGWGTSTTSWRSHPYQQNPDRVERLPSRSISCVRFNIYTLETANTDAVRYSEQKGGWQCIEGVW